MNPLKKAKTFSNNIFQFTDYKEFILAIEQENATAKGYRSQMAASMGVHAAFISQVLNHDKHLSLEQATKLTQFLRLDQREQRFFLFLVEYARAGTQDLKDFFLREIVEMQKLEYRLGSKKDLEPEHETVYYSQWFYAAIVTLTTIPFFRTSARISHALNLSLKQTEAALNFLTGIEFLQVIKGEYHPTSKHFHLSKNSPNIFKHHMNWRHQALKALENPSEQNFHISTCVSLSRQAVEEIRKQFVEELQRKAKTVQNASEEELWGLNIDFFNLIRK